MVPCRLDHIFSTFRTAAGRLRRMDVILVTPDQLPYALIGWIGSTMFNRFLRRHMNHGQMHLNSQGLWRIKHGRIVRVPDQGPPINRRGQEYWPPGWGPDSEDTAGGEDAPAAAAAAAGGRGTAAAEVARNGVEGCSAAAGAAPAAAAAAGAAAAASGDGSRRRVRTQRDIFELLELPWREPYQRDVP